MWTRLETVFTVKKFFAEGGFSRETFIQGRSGVDVFAKVTLDEIRWGNEPKSSFTVLDNFREELAARLPYTKVGRAFTPSWLSSATWKWMASQHVPMMI